VLTPDFFQHNKLPVLESGFLMVEGALQNQDGVVTVKAEYVEGLRQGAVAASHDFH
jgi:error-prone DNA polymerase